MPDVEVVAQADLPRPEAAPERTMDERGERVQSRLACEGNRAVRTGKEHYGRLSSDSVDPWDYG